MRRLVSEAEVPALVRRYLERVLPTEGSVPRQVRVTQVGEMRQKPGGRWLRFSAVEDFAVEEVAFSWRARFPLAPLVSLRVVDRYADGEGQLEARLLGLVPVLRARGQKVAEGEALRYLAELAWVPQAILANPPARVARARRGDRRGRHTGRVGEGGAAARVRRCRGSHRRVGRLASPHGGQEDRAEPGPAATATTLPSAGSAFRRGQKCAGSLPTARSPTGAAASLRSSSTLRRELEYADPGLPRDDRRRLSDGTLRPTLPEQP